MAGYVPREIQLLISYKASGSVLTVVRRIGWTSLYYHGVYAMWITLRTTT